VRVVPRYLLSLFMKNLELCLAGFIALYMVVEFLEKISNFMDAGIRARSVFIYFAAQVPNVAVLLTPVAVLAAVLITLVLLARNSEIVALKGSGYSLWSLSTPFLFAGLALSVLVFVLGNFVTPRTSEAANSIWDGEVQNQRQGMTAEAVHDVWAKDVRLLTHFGSWNEAAGEALDAMVVTFDDSFNMTMRIEAERAIFTDSGAVFYNAGVKEYQAYASGGPRAFTFRRLGEFPLEGLPKPPPGLGRHSELNSDELSVGELSENIRLLKAEGYNPVRQTVDLNFKFSRPFITLVMVIVGLPIGFWREKGGSIAMGLVPGLILSFAYLVTMELSRTIGYAGYLPPLVAAWLPNCFFLLLGVYLFSYVRQ
jgi:lipopolysaccharide export system permease protein